jgi:hypothetical protein
MIAAVSTDALEREMGLAVQIEGEALLFELTPYQLRSFRVRFSNEA